MKRDLRQLLVGDFHTAYNTTIDIAVFWLEDLFNNIQFATAWVNLLGSFLSLGMWHQVGTEAVINATAKPEIENQYKTIVSIASVICEYQGMISTENNSINLSDKEQINKYKTECINNIEKHYPKDKLFDQLYNRFTHSCDGWFWLLLNGWSTTVMGRYPSPGLIRNTGAWCVNKCEGLPDDLQACIDRHFGSTKNLYLKEEENQEAYGKMKLLNNRWISENNEQLFTDQFYDMPKEYQSNYIEYLKTKNTDLLYLTEEY